jgi:hypothetical protein
MKLKINKNFTKDQRKIIRNKNDKDQISKK